MLWFLWLLSAAIVAFAIIYFFFPAWLVVAIIGSVRKWGRMSAKSIVADSITWPYLEGGPADAETIVMVHGFGGDKDNWPLYARHFTNRYRVIAPDLPGFGENVRDPGLNYGGAAQTERLHAFLTELGLENIHLSGNSMGGFIALNYALTYPHNVKTLTLIDNAGVTSTHKSELEIAIDGGENPLVATSMEDFDRLLDFVMHKRIPSPRFMMRAMLAIQIRNRDLLDAIFWQIIDEALKHSLTDRLGEVSMPTLVIWGRHDRLIDVSCAEVMAATIPDNRVVVLEDVGHVPMIESPRETAQHQLAMIAEIQESAR
jgi:pimeloyl-ACP methyl ester carboxylesterase